MYTLTKDYISGKQVTGTFNSDLSGDVTIRVEKDGFRNELKIPGDFADCP